MTDTSKWINVGDALINLDNTFAITIEPFGGFCNRNVVAVGGGGERVIIAECEDDYEARSFLRDLEDDIGEDATEHLWKD